MEVTFYDKTGHPVVYLSTTEENSIYTWDGHAVAYIMDDLIYGWRGKHLGWYVEGILYDLKGNKVGSIKEKCPYITYTEYTKYIKYTKYAKYARNAPNSRPSFNSSYSNQLLIDFVSQDKI